MREVWIHSFFFSKEKKHENFSWNKAAAQQFISQTDLSATALILLKVLCTKKIYFIDHHTELCRKIPAVCVFSHHPTALCHFDAFWQQKGKNVARPTPQKIKQQQQKQKLLNINVSVQWQEHF